MGVEQPIRLTDEEIKWFQTLKILLVEGENNVLLVSRILGRRNIPCAVCKPSETIRALSQQRYDLAIMPKHVDLRSQLYDRDGESLVARVRESLPTLPIMILSSDINAVSALYLTRILGANDAVHKESIIDKGSDWFLGRVKRAIS